MKVTVNKCPDTGKLFEDDKEYKTHRDKMRREKLAAAKDKKVKDTFFHWLAEEKKLITSVDMIPAWFLKNQRIIMDAFNVGCRGTGHNGFWVKFKDTDEFTKFKITGVYYSRSVSNSHSCPRNGVTNWGGQRVGAPNGYPGWSVRVAGSLFRLPKDGSEYPYGDALNLIGIHTGTGGGGNESWGYDAKIFLDDWSGLKAQVDEMEQNDMVKILKGVR